MRLVDLFSSALYALRLNLLRSALTTLGIVIGVAAVVATMALTTGLEAFFTEQFSGLGSNTFQIQKHPHMRMGRHGHSKWHNRPDIDEKNADAIRERDEWARFVGAELWNWGMVLRSRYTTTQAQVVVAGGTPEFAPNNGYDVSQGRTLNPGDVQHGRNLVVLGADLARDLFPHSSSVGSPVNFSGRRFTVIGVFASKGSFFGMGSRDNFCLIPISTFVALYGKRRSVNVTVQAMDMSVFEQARDKAIQIMRQERSLKPEDDDNFETFSNQSTMDQVNELTGWVNVAALAIAIISLLVGGIGIMNIMMVSVTERTREIGIRRALGARKRHILWQFTVEAVFLSALGGLLGLGVGYGAAYLANELFGLPAAAPPWAVAVALGMSSAAGLIFGIYPAYKASQQDPIEALHYE